MSGVDTVGSKRKDILSSPGFTAPIDPVMLSATAWFRASGSIAEQNPAALMPTSGRFLGLNTWTVTRQHWLDPGFRRWITVRRTSYQRHGFSMNRLERYTDGFKRTATVF
jgi:hypothetical protein